MLGSFYTEHLSKLVLNSLFVDKVNVVNIGFYVYGIDPKVGLNWRELSLSDEHFVRIAVVPDYEISM